MAELTSRMLFLVAERSNQDAEKRICKNEFPWQTCIQEIVQTEVLLFLRHCYTYMEKMGKNGKIGKNGKNGKKWDCDGIL